MLQQLCLQLPPKMLHPWPTICVNDHVTIHQQSLLSGMMSQVVIQDLLFILFICCSIDVCHNIWSDNSFAF